MGQTHQGDHFYLEIELLQSDTFIIDPQGRIQRVYASVEPNKHSQEVLSALDELARANLPRSS